MQERATTGDSKLLALAERMRSLRFNVKTEVHFDGQAVAIMARRARIEIERGCLTEDFFMVAQFDHLDHAILKDYSRKCFKYALRNRLIPLPWGWPALHFATCYAVAAVSTLDSSLASDLTKRAPILRWWRGHEFPAVWDLTTGCLYYPQATSEFGRIWNLQRRVALEVLSPVA